MSQTFNQLQATNQWKIDEMNTAIKSDYASDFATVAEVQALINKWKILESNCNAENKKITIKNFRSISNFSIDCARITCFAGNNDAGKSNVLRALNLFFKNETDYLQSFNFKRDFNQFASVSEKKAKEISVELLIELPTTYRRSGYPENVIWRKVWRENGYHEAGNFRLYENKSKFPSKSRVPLLLDRVTYNYVPAIKDKLFFTDLQGQLYDVLSLVAEKDLRESASKFESQIQGQVKDLLSSVSDVFKSESFMKLPENLRQVFENLEFNNADGISLSRRGDGIKVRHIPAILRFIAEKRNSIHKQGVNYHIWVFEEPENNVEMAASFDMVGEFAAAADNEYQILLTTHSTVFYGISEKHLELAIVYRVIKQDKLSDLKLAIKDATDNDLGLAQIVAPYVYTERHEWEERQVNLEQQVSSLKALSADDKKLKQIFVEGKTDVKVIEKFISVFYPSIKSGLKLDAGGADGYGGAAAASNRASAWHLMQQHAGEPVKAALLLDDDAAGKVAQESFNKITTSSAVIVKVFVWKAPSKPVGLDEGFELPKDIEFLYSDAAWQYAEKQGWLEQRDLGKHISITLQKKINDAAINSEQVDMFGSVSLAVRLGVQKKFSDSGKESISKWICALPDEEVKQHLADLSKSLKLVLTHLEIEVES